MDPRGPLAFARQMYFIKAKMELFEVQQQRWCWARALDGQVAKTLPDTHVLASLLDFSSASRLLLTHTSGVLAKTLLSYDLRTQNVI